MSATAQLGYMSVQAGSGGTSTKLSPALSVGFTVDLTYTRTGTPSGKPTLELGASTSLGVGLIGGGNVNVTEGKVSGAQVSIGVGVAIPSTKLVNLDNPAQKTWDLVGGLVGVSGQ